MDSSITTQQVVVLQPDRQSSGVKLITPIVKDDDKSWGEGKRYIQKYFSLPSLTFPYVIDVFCTDAFGPDKAYFAVGEDEDEEFYIPWTEITKIGRWGLPDDKVMLAPTRGRNIKLTVHKGKIVSQGFLYLNIEYRHLEFI
tara:strand:+ start:319 stop:741 length:423 start_codon:yes stop_codon:yes gene_type:complete